MLLVTRLFLIGAASAEPALSEWSTRILQDARTRYNFTAPYKIGIRQVFPPKHMTDHPPFWMSVPIKFPRGPTINDVVWERGRFYVPREETIAHAMMGPQCKVAGATKPPIVLDIGGNTGYFSLLAASCGCRAHAFEPRVDMAAYIELSARFNGFGPDQLTLHRKLVTHEKNVKFDGWNTVSDDESLTGHATKACKKGSKCLKEAAAKDGRMRSFGDQSVAIDELIDEDVLYMKVDVEGHEPSAMLSAQRLISTRVVRYILFEVTYYLLGRWTTPKYERLMVWLSKQGYTLYHVEAGQMLSDPKSSRLRQSTPAEIKAELRAQTRGCDPKRTHFCQAGNYFAVHPKAAWPLRPDHLHP